MNMEKIRFGTREIVAMVAGVTLFACLRVIENFLFSKGILPEYLTGWLSPGLMVIAVTAVFFGPISGMLCAVGGDLIVRALFGSSVGFLELFTLGLYGLLIGLYYGKLHYRHDRFGMREFIDFNVIQTLVGIVCGIFIMPLGQLLLDGTDINEAIVQGTQRTIGITLMVGVILSVIMFIVSIVSSRHKSLDA